MHPTPISGELRVELPWPNKLLSPNARVHWAKKAKVTMLARADTMWALRPWVVGEIKSDAVHVAMEFCPPDRRRRDLDNCIGSTKAHRDGIADALGVDDSKFQTTYSMGDPVKGGAVLVTIRGTA